MEMQQGQTAGICGMDKQHEHAGFPFTCRHDMGIQHAHSAGKCSMEKQHGNTA
jgi:hypothetical protein